MIKSLIRSVRLINWRRLAAHPSTLVCFLMMLFVSRICIGQEWIRYIDLQERFTVNFPHEPEIQEINYPSEYGVEFPARVYTADDPPTRYSLTVVNYSETERLHRERSARTGIPVYAQEWISDVLGSIAYAAWNIRKRGGEVTYDAFHTVDRIAGHLLQATNTDQSRTFAGIYLHDSRLYILEATVLQGAPPPGHFQQSLGIFDEEGRRVRYNLDVDGNRTRDYSEAPYVDELPVE